MAGENDPVLRAVLRAGGLMGGTAPKTCELRNDLRPA